MNVRLFKPSLGEEELNNIKDSFDKAWIGLGPKVARFEKEWCGYIGCKSSIGLNSATAALHLALTSFGFREGQKVLVPAITFASTAFAPVYNRLEPVFVDVDEDTVSISMEDLERKFSKDCVAVMPVHFGGHPANMDMIIDFAKSKKLKVVEDCAHTAGSSYKGKKLGTWGDIGCFSFEEKKAMTTGDGGMMCSDDEELIAPMKACRWVGIDKDTWKRVEGYTDTKALDAMHWYYEIASLGFKYNMNDLSASIGLAQLKKLDRMNADRSRHIERYMEGIRDLKNIKPLLPFSPDKNSYWLFGVRCEKRDELIIHLKSKGIATGVHYVPLMLFPFFKRWDNGCSISKRIWKEFITLPLFADLKNEEIDYVLESLKEFDRKY
ncbi:MAG: DegT/DnrJ/EryC1/StrS family aminotransferase [Ignavibacteriae bacterium]|nr:DegT/DnrJ/EryC1/StrS family aminotransferase [Ignavibacteriota bacterium]